MYETPPTATRANSIGSALSRMFGKNPLDNEQVRPVSADSPLTPQDKSPKRQNSKLGSSRNRANSRPITWNANPSRTQDNLVDYSNPPNGPVQAVDGEVDATATRRAAQTHRGGEASYLAPMETIAPPPWRAMAPAADAGDDYRAAAEASESMGKPFTGPEFCTNP